MKRILITGTGTDVGKSVVAQALARSCCELGGAPLGLKPIESGYVEATSDALGLSLAAGHAPIAPLYTFVPAVSPHIAARDERIEVSMRGVAKWVATAAERSTSTGPAIIETAGGLFSPLSATCVVVDLALVLKPQMMILVASNRLGVLHDVLVCLAALAGKHLAVDAVVLSDARPDHSSEANPTELQRLIEVPVFHAKAGCERLPELAQLVL